ncbi:hypothetical protein HP456_08555 [Bacillus haikouensis]|jgi:hypothetical protein|uniref:hypothetical protein n=1 Tax=Bacillus haikouensis TaxID=1510468 RepID=UPI001556E9AD|nr:hypothetical protein [Bacillus haikouensis]NQD65974.1 hypothetical protein [Bacillus haikouensis]
MLKKGVSLTIASTLMVSAFAPYSKALANEGEQEKSVVFEESVKLANEIFEVKQTDEGATMKSTIIGEKGTMVTVMDKETKKYISLETDYLPQEEEREQLSKMNEATLKEVKIQKDEKEEIHIEKSNIVAPKAVGEWYYGVWKDYEVSFADKTATAAIASLIVSWIPYVGRVAGAAAAICVAYGMSTGYFSSRRDYKILSGSYMMERQNLKTYGDKYHMMLLDYSTSEKKIWIGI